MLVKITNKKFTRNAQGVEFVKTLRHAFGLSLKEAKDILDAFRHRFVEDEVGIIEFDLPVTQSELKNLSKEAQKLVMANSTELVDKVKALLIEALEQDNYQIALGLAETLNRTV